VEDEVKKADELKVGIPKDNLTIAGLAKKLASGIQRRAIPVDKAARSQWSRTARTRLIEVVRYAPSAVKHAWPLGSTRSKDVNAQAYRLEFEGGLSATAVSAANIKAADDAPSVILLNVAGRQSMRLGALAGGLARGEQILAVNLIFTGDASPDTPKNQPVRAPEMYRKVLSTPDQLPHVVDWLKTRPPSALYGLLLSAIGQRPLGMQAAQLIGIARWLRKDSPGREIHVETVGMRSQVTALVAAAMEPGCFSRLATRDSIKSLGYLLEHSVRYQDAPDLFCLDLYKDFDIDMLAALAEPTTVTQDFIEAPVS